MVLIANPIYDVVFKFMMEDDKVAKLLLSTLLNKEVVELQMRNQEFTSMYESRISLFRLDFSAKIKEADGSESLIIIELQKTWLDTETLRFRQYLGYQYIDKTNILKDNDSHKSYGLPIVSIYILGHKLGDLEEPIIYVKRQYLDYESKIISQGVPDRFIESLTHDSIIIQLPFLNGKVKNRLESLLKVFDQTNRTETDSHVLEIDEFDVNPDNQILIKRLTQAVLTPNIRKNMEIEDEILSEIEARDTMIMEKDKKIEEKDKKIEEKDSLIKEQQEKLKFYTKLLADKGIIED